MRRIAIFSIIALMGFPLPMGMADVAAAQDDNAAVAVNTRDGSTVFRLAFSVRQVMDGTVDQTNAAVAYASCSSCETVAIAIQVVLVYGGADVVEPTNLALAVNDSCDTCLTAAMATQLVFGAGQDQPLTGPFWGEIGRLRARFQQLRTTEFASLEALQAEVDAITGELERLLREQMTGADDEGEPADVAGDAEESDATSTTSTTAGDDQESTTSTTEGSEATSTTSTTPPEGESTTSTTTSEGETTTTSAAETTTTTTTSS